MRSTPSECRCCSAYLEYGGKLCQQCREELSSDLYDVPKLLESHNALSGIPDPAAAIKAAREAMEEMIAMCEPLVHDDEGDGDPLAKYRHALSLLTPKGTP